MTDSKLNKDVNELKEKTKQKLDILVIEKFPQKIAELQKLINEKLSAKNVSTVATEVKIPIPQILNNQTDGQSSQSQVSRTGPDNRVLLFPRGVEPSNKTITEYLDIVKPLVLDFSHDMRTIRFAIQLMVPKVEDANNLGVEIQEATIHALSKAENQALARLNQFYHYFSGRGNIVSLIAKYPHCDDYRKALKVEDENFYLILCLIVRELRDNYLSLHDLIVKNMSKIKDPRTLHSHDMY
jgi:proteasome activator subunit 3 (PA28 gamma)